MVAGIAAGVILIAVVVGILYLIKNIDSHDDCDGCNYYDFEDFD